MSKLHVKAGDMVEVIAGSQKGKSGKVQAITRDRQRALVEGLNLMKKHQKPTQDIPEGSIVEREAPIHLSNLKVIN